MDDRRVISGIVHVLKSGCRWCDCPPEYGRPTTIYNLVRALGAARHLGEPFPEACWERASGGDADDRPHAHQTRLSAAGGKGGSRSRLLAACAEGATRRYTHSRMLKDAFSPSC